MHSQNISPTAVHGIKHRNQMASTRCFHWEAAEQPLRFFPVLACFFQHTPFSLPPSHALFRWLYLVFRVRVYKYKFQLEMNVVIVFSAHR